MNTLLHNFAARAPRITIIIVLTSALTLLNACKSVTPTQIENLTATTIVDTSAHQNILKKMTSWKISGKLSVISPENRSSVYINWQQSKNRSDNRFIHNTNINMTNLLGISVAKLEYDGKLAMLQSDGKQYTDKTPDRLIQQLTGWNLPVTNLRQWIKALPTNNDQITYNQYKLVASILPSCSDCQAWNIKYDKYRKINGIWLPHSVKLSNSQTQTRLTFSISKWYPQ